MNYKKEWIIAKYRRLKLFLQVDLPYNFKKFITRLSRKVEDNLIRFMRNHPEIYPTGQPFATVGDAIFGGGLYLKHTRASDGKTVDYGLVSRAKVTAEFVAYLTDQLQTEDTTIGDFKYHISGTDATAEANTHTSLLGATGTVRTIGTQTEGASAWIYQSAATITYTSTHAVVEHGIFNAAYSASQADGTLLDRSTFSAVNVVSADTVTYTYQLTNTSEA
jgi:hypothetical protein